MNLLDPDTIGSLIGVVDLKAGQAVHAVAGQRDQYQEVVLRRPAVLGRPNQGGIETPCGDPERLAAHYAALGLRRLYIADLDAICGGAPQASALSALIADPHWDQILLDLGWRDDREELTALACRLARDHRQLQLIAATEAAAGLGCLASLADAITPQRVLVGMDYRAGQFIGCGGTESDWIHEASRLGIDRIVALDVATVGTGKIDAAEALCRRLASLSPESQIYSGGGIGTGDDVRRMSAAGCDACLVGTRLHQL
ncbi:MAG: hypothetical protein HKN47_19730 [Pirellulaceae bacterium]|nr:hypothetical protein [Pirellulaceae bacterium]